MASLGFHGRRLFFDSKIAFHLDVVVYQTYFSTQVQHWRMERSMLSPSLRGSSVLRSRNDPDYEAGITTFY
jgi:hypothetical protein